MRYMLLIYSDETLYAKLAEAETDELLARYRAVGEEARAAGVFVTADRLRPTTTATTVQNRGGDTVTTDGPFAETKEQLGGFYVIDVPDLDRAIRWAAKLPAAEYGRVEVRPVWDLTETP